MIKIVKTNINRHKLAWQTQSALTQTDVNCHGGRLACTTTQASAKAQRCQYVIASECEAIQPIEKAGLEQQNTGLIHVKNLFPCLGFAPRSQSLACCAYAQAGSICSLSGFAHFVRVIRPQIRYSPKNN